MSAVGWPVGNSLGGAQFTFGLLLEALLPSAFGRLPEKLPENLLGGQKTPYAKTKSYSSDGRKRGHLFLASIGNPLDGFGSAG